MALYRITTHNACFGIETTNNVVTKAAPIAIKSCMGRHIQYVFNYFQQKFSAKIEKIG